MIQAVFDFFGSLFTRIIPLEWRNSVKRQRDDDVEVIDCDERIPPVKKLRMNPDLQNQGSKYFPEFFSHMKTKDNSSQTIEVIDLDEHAVTTESSSVSDKENSRTKVNKSSPGKNTSPRKCWYKPPSHCRSPHKTKFKNVSTRRASDDVQYVGTYSKNDSTTPGISSCNERSTIFRRILPNKSFSARTHRIMNHSLSNSNSFQTSSIYNFQSRKKYGEILGKVLKSPELFAWSPSPRPSFIHSKVIDLTEDEPVPSNSLSKSRRVSRKSASETVDLTGSPQKKTPDEVVNLDSDNENNTAEESSIPHGRIVSPVNSLFSSMGHIPCASNDYLSTLAADIEELKKEFVRDTDQLSKEITSMCPLRKSFEKALEERLQRHLKITSIDLSDEEEEKEDFKPQLSDEMTSAVMNAWDSKKPKGQVLVNNFNYQIKRADLQTLSGLNWLNDEVINFYMELITARGKEKDFPSVHTFSTFFYSKLEKDGYSSLRRWTRKVDIFSFDLIVVPIHLRVHWCLAVINMKKKTITYFDSMGQSNNTCVNSLLKYLADEHMDKKKEPFDTSGWEVSCTKDSVPQQMNSCDCGVFACTFAEYTTREAKYNFSQDDMPYFRSKMTFEILDSKLLSWK